MESIGYILMYFLRGSLPWQGLEAPKTVLGVKMETTVKELCRGYPGAFAIYINYTRGLGFDEKPDYEYLRGLFRDLAVRKNIQYDGKFDWVDQK
jgi:hypothetical protein